MACPSLDLLLVLFQTLVAIGLGYTCKHFNLLSKEQVSGIGFYVGKIAFPLLVFKTVATADLGQVNVWVVLACNCGKACVFLATFMLTFLLYKTNGHKSQRLLTSTIFGFFSTASNDFALGFPVINALYGPTMAVYIAANALVNAVLIQPIAMILLEVGKSMAAKENRPVGAQQGSQARNMVLEIILNPIIVLAFLGLGFNFVGTLIGENEVVSTISASFWQVLELLASPFGALALFLTGTSLRSAKVEAWPIALVIMKVMVCAYLSFLFSELFGLGDQDLQDFTFFYGSLPTSSGPLIFAAEFDPSSTDLVSTAILFGLGLAGPNMFVTSLFLAKGNENMLDILRSVQHGIAITSLLFALVFILFLLSTVKKWKYPRNIIAVYGIVSVVYSGTLFYLTQYPTSCIGVLDDPWSPVGLLFAWGQNACRFLILFLQYLCATHWKLHPRVSNPMLDWTHHPMTQAGFICVLAVIPSLLVKANTISAICVEGYHFFTFIPMLILTSCCLLATIFLGLMGNVTLSDAQKPLTDSEVDEAAIGPSCVVNTLVSIQGLRLFIQVVNETSALGRGVTGGFTEMLIVENILEHGQVMFLVAAILWSPNFKSVFTRPQILQHFHRAYQLHSFHHHHQ